MTLPSTLAVWFSEQDGCCVAEVRCPVWLTHGIADDVIPYTQAESLARAFPAHAQPPVLLTGLYGHTQIEGARGPVAAARELTAMVRIVSAIERAASNPDL